MNQHLTDNQIEALLGKAKNKLTLTTNERTTLRSHLMAEISHTPQVSHGWQSSRIARIPMLAPMLLAAVIAIGSGTAALANNALPGTPLYPIGQLVEQAQIKLITSPDARAQLYADLSQKKVSQLAVIDSQDTAKMTASQKNRWQKNHATATAEVAASIEKVSQIQASFQAKLESTTDPKVKDTLRVVNDHIQAAVNDRDQVLAHIADQESIHQDMTSSSTKDSGSTNPAIGGTASTTTVDLDQHTGGDNSDSHTSVTQGSSASLSPTTDLGGSQSGSATSPVK